jgi:hypothetical protein
MAILRMTTEAAPAVAAKQNKTKQNKITWPLQLQPLTEP